MVIAPEHGERRGAPRGRPRDASRDEALRQATMEVLAEVGYRAMTMDAVAAKARAGKATIYRRWESKLDLVIDTCNQLVSQDIPPPNTGSVLDDLREFLRGFVGFFNGTAGRFAQALVSELPHEPELAETFRGKFVAVQRAVMRGILERGVKRGEISHDAPLDLAVEIIGATMLYRLILTGEPLDTEFVNQLVDEALHPMLTHCGRNL